MSTDLQIRALVTRMEEQIPQYNENFGYLKQFPNSSNNIKCNEYYKFLPYIDCKICAKEMIIQTASQIRNNSKNKNITCSNESCQKNYKQDSEKLLYTCNLCIYCAVQITKHFNNLYYMNLNQFIRNFKIVKQKLHWRSGEVIVNYIPKYSYKKKIKQIINNIANII